LIIRSCIPIVLGFGLGLAAICGTVGLSGFTRAQAHVAASNGMTTAQYYQWRSLLFGHNTPAEAVVELNSKISDAEEKAKKAEEELASATGSLMQMRLEDREEAKMTARVLTERRDFMQRMATEFPSPPPPSVWLSEHKRVYTIYEELIAAHNKIANTKQPQDVVLEDNVRLEEIELREDYLKYLKDIIKNYRR
jgi:hypothetical protein